MIKIADYDIGSAAPPFVIAEVAQTHDGSLGQAMALIEVAADCGAQAIKFQTHIAAEESTAREPWRIPFSRQDTSRYDYWRRLEFSRAQWTVLKEHAEKHGLVFLSSPFSIRACEWLEELRVPAWKIASGEVRNRELLQWIARTRKPVLLSGGLTADEELIAAARELEASGCPVALMHCTSSYPTLPEHVGLNRMLELQGKITPWPVGLSDHSASPVPGIVASYLGACLIEVHLTLHERMFGPDVVASLTPSGLKTLVDGARFAWIMRTNPVNSTTRLQNLNFDPKIFGRSWVTARALPRGHRLAPEDLAFKKPGGGLDYDQAQQLLGRALSRSVEKDHPLEWTDVQST